MSEVLLEVVRQRIQLTHGWLLKVIDELTVEELGRRLAPTATPIGWHLWHVSRWADRLHASFPNRPYSPGGRWDAERQLWFQDGLSRRWGLDPRTLGILQTGSWMDDDAAVAVARAGRDPLVD